MVISHKYKYIFVELPITASTAITNQLIEFYDGENILNKHSSYKNLKKFYKGKYDDYFVFSSIRNPLDRTVSLYEKLMTVRFDDEKKSQQNWYFQLKANYLKRNTSFEDYFLKYYKFPYDDWASLDHNKFDFIIHYESLQEDFSKVLKLLNIKQVREIPMINKTKSKKDFLSYYTPRIRKRAINVFGPYCKKFGYDLPWDVKKVPSYNILLFKALAVFRKIIWIQMKNYIIKKEIKAGVYKI